MNLRICGCEERPTSREHLMIWLSYNDLIQLVKKSITATIEDVVTIYGISNNTRSFFKTDPYNALGYKPEDNAEEYIIELPEEFNHEEDRKFVGGHEFVKRDAVED